MPFRAPVFVDTVHILALYNTGDQWHNRAKQWARRTQSESVPLVTTELVLTEVGNALAPVSKRSLAVRVIKAFQAAPNVQVIPASHFLFEAALDLYESRIDKDWGLTDCTSFLVMRDHKLEAALTVDRHFQQAGFRALLLEESGE